MRRASTRIDPTLIDDFNWDDLVNEDPRYQQNFNDAAFDDQFNNVNNFLDYSYGGEQTPSGMPGGHASFNYYENPGVAVPGTPRNASFPSPNHHSGRPMSTQAGTSPLVQVVLNGQIRMLPQGQADAMKALFAQTSPQNMLTDAKRTSIPKSPGLRKRRQSQAGGQTLYQDPFEGSGLVDPMLFDLQGHNNPVYPDPAASYDTEGYYPEPYYQSTYFQGPPTPSRPVRAFPSEPEYLQPVSQQKVSQTLQAFGSHSFHTHVHRSPVAARNSSVSVYPARGEPSGRGRRSVPTSPMKNARPETTDALPNKRISVFDHDTVHQYQKPQVSTFNPEVRINKTTKGLTTRTAKINEYDPRHYYTYTPHPLGTLAEPYGAAWRHRNGRYTHRYRDSSLRDDDGGNEIAIYELEDRAMSADKVQDFILNYPSDRNTLTLRIQVGPGDSSRRYRASAAKCRFAECPNREGQLPATIKHGWYRIAFDERSDDSYDPFAACCGFVHLYCAERFLDFEYICRNANIMVDFRSHLRHEPKGTFAAAFHNKQVNPGQLADTFIQYARAKPDGNVSRKRDDRLGVRQLEDFVNYPVYRPYSGDIWDTSYDFESTLSYHMMRVMEAHRPFAQLTQFAEKGLGPTQLSVHRGDLGMQVEAYVREKLFKKNNKARSKKGKKVARTYAFDGNSAFDIEVRRRIDRAQHVIEMKSSQARAFINSNKRATVPDEDDEIVPDRFGKLPWQVDDDESDVEDADRTVRTGARRSKRNAGKQPNYRDEPEASRAYERPPERSRKRSYQEFEQSQQTTNQYSYDPAFQYRHDDYGQFEYPQELPRARTPKRKRTVAPLPGFAQAEYYRPESDSQHWELGDYTAYDAGDFDHLGLGITLAPSPCSPKRKRTSRGSEQLDHPDSPQYGRYPSRRLSSIAGSSRANSIRRHSVSRTPLGSKRRASFNNQPVSQQKTFNSNAPPHSVQPRMVKELEDVSYSPHSLAAVQSPGRTLRSGQPLGSIAE